MQPSVENLFEQWRSRGDHRALAALFDRTAPELWRVARHLSGNRSEAEDLLQATFLAVMESASRFRTGQALVPWMLGILANKLRMARRRQRLQAALAPGEPPPAEDPVAAAAASEARGLLQARLATLPEAYRAVLVLQFEHGFSAAEIAHTLGRPLATVRSQVYRGLELLRRALPLGLSATPGSDEPPPDLRSVRAAVIVAAGSKATVAVSTLGVTLMAKKLLVGVAVLLCAGAWYGWPRASETAPVVSTPVAATPAPAAPRSPTAAEPSAPQPEPARTLVADVPHGAGSLRVHVLWDDGTVAASMAVCVQPVGTDPDWFAQRWQATDARGETTYMAMVPGKVQVRARHGGRTEVTIGPATTTDAQLTIPKGVLARGSVVDPAGQPVAGAIVVVGRRSDEMLEATRTDGNGAFVLRDLDARGLVAAFAEGFLQSRVVSGDEFATEPQQLQLAGPGGTVAGRVLDTEGRPLAGAWVAHGYGTHDGPPLVAMRAEITNAKGEFRLQGLQPAMQWPLHAGAAGHAAWRGNVYATAGSVAEVEIRLDPAVTLRGVVRGPSGEPMRGIVEALDANAPGKRIQDPRPPWSQSHQTTGADGVYAFFHLRPGAIVVSARDNHDAVAGTTLQARPGDALVWDPVLNGDLAIRGTLLDDGDRPLVGWCVTAEPPEGMPLLATVKTAANGSFALVGCVQVPHRIHVSCAGNGWGESILERRGVEPSGEPLVLRISRAAMPSCVVSGTLAADQAGGGTYLLLVGERGGTQLKGPLVSGEPFELGAVPPGRYALQMLKLLTAGQWDDQIVAPLGAHELQAGQRLDLGEVRMPALGELAITLVDAKGRSVPEAKVTLGLVGAPMAGAAIAIHDGHGTHALAPGTYMPTGGGGVSIEHPPIVVAAGARNELRLQVAATVHRQVRYDLTAVGVMRAVGTWKKSGTPMLRHAFDFWQEHPSTIDHDFTPGSWVLELELGNGSVQQFPFVVTADDTAPVIEIKVTR